ncbi:MAG: ATP-dependent DNA helicase [Candidatus Hodarchaeales archaeon]
MVIRIVEDKCEISLGVGDLVSSNGFYHEQSGFKFGKRLIIGQKLHQEYGDKLKLKNESITTEKHVKHEFTYQKGRKGIKWSVKLSGRVDVFIKKKGKYFIEEIKTLTPEDFKQITKSKEDNDLLSRFANQIKLYLYIIELTEGIKCHGSLVLINIDNSKIKKITVKNSNMSKFIDERLETIVSAWKEQKEFFQKRASNAIKISFPFSSYRPYQEEVINKVEECLINRKSLMISAPTGIGKTISVLFPALKYSLANGKRIIYVTPKTTQQKLVIETLNLFKKQRLGFTCVELQAKEKSCVNNVYCCHPDFCSYIQDYSKKLKREHIDKLRAKKVITPRIIKNFAVKAKLCPFELSLDLALEVDLILGDYNYVFDPNVYLKRFFFDRRYDDFLLIIDEAHNLYSRGRGYYSPELSLKSIQRLEDDLRRKKRKIYRPFYPIIHELAEYMRNLLQQGAREKRSLVKYDIALFEKLKRELDIHIEEYFIWKNKNVVSSSRDDPVEGFYLVFNRFYRVLRISQKKGTFEYYTVKKPHDTLNILCLDPSDFLKKRMKGFWNVNAISATLTPLDFYKKVLGMPDNTETLTTPSPFPSKNRFIAVIPEISTYYRDRERDSKKLAWIIKTIAGIHEGNYFAFFPSFDYMMTVLDKLNHLGAKNLLVQDRTMSDRSRRKFLEQMTKSKTGLICLGVQGGIFSEGVDYPGDLLEGTFLIGPGLPAYNFENELIRKYFDKKYNGEGWRFAYMYPGMNRIIQAAGRSIRTMKDKGLIILLGNRFSKREYSNLFPGYWYRDLPEELIKTDYLGDISKFWKSHGEKTEFYDYEE